MSKIVSLMLLMTLSALAVAVHAEETANQAAVQQLLQSARLWVVKKRDDLALDALHKASLLAPTDPEIQVQAGMIALRTGNVPEANRIMQDLEARFKDSPQTEAFRESLRLETTDRHQLATAIFISKKAPHDRAAMLPVLESLFPGGRPKGEAALVYYRLLGRIPGHQNESIQGLQSLKRSMPNDPRLDLEIAIIQLKDDPMRIKGLETLSALSHRNDVDEELLNNAFEDGLSDVERTPKTEALFKAFEARFPGVHAPELVLTDTEKRERQRDERTAKAELQAQKGARDLAAGHLIEAESALKAAYEMDPDDSEYPIRLGQIYLKENKSAEALALFQKLLTKRPDNDRAAVGTMDAQEHLGRRVEAIQWGGEWLRRHPKQIAVQATWTGLIRDESDSLMASGKDREAQRLLEQALLAAPQSGWIRYDLARLDAKSGHPKQGAARFEGMPETQEMIKAKALYLSSIDDVNGALELLHAIPNNSKTLELTNLQKKLEVEAAIHTAMHEAQAGHFEAARKGINGSCSQHPDAEFVWACAKGFAAIGEKEKALQIARGRLAETAPHTPVTDEIRFAELSYTLKDEESLQRMLEILRQRPDANPEERAEISSLSVRTIVREAWALRRQKDAEGAIRILDDALKVYPNNAKLASALGDMQILGKAPDVAVDLYRATLNAHPSEVDLEISLAEALWLRGDKDEARSLLDRLDRSIPPVDLDHRILLARALILSGQAERGEAILGKVRSSPSLAPETRLALAKAEKKAQLYDRAIEDVRLLTGETTSNPPLIVEPADRTEALEVKKDIDARRFGYASTGIDVRQLYGSSGMSQILNLDSANLIRVADGYDGHYFVQTDLAGVFAGELDLATFANAQQFGTINALCAGGATGTGTYCSNGKASAQSLAAGSLNNATLLPAQLNQQAYGASLAVGYQWDHWQVDLGSTPMGFEVTNVVGGIHHSGAIGDGFYSVDVYRRPMPNSLLSYAGVKDPVTGAVWGGVTVNGGGFYAGSDLVKTDIGTLSGFVQGSGQYFQGTNTLSNAEGMARLGGDFSFIDDEDMELSLGLAGMFLSFQNNQRHYSFGYGGYWSPQLYSSISLPLQWTGRTGDFTYFMRAYAAFSYSSEDSGAFYPTSQALQFSDLNQNAYWGSTSGTALSYGIKLKTEYKATDQLYLGAQFEKAQSPFYTPNYGGLYIRYAFEPHEEAMPFPPENPLPYYRW